MYAKLINNQLVYPPREYVEGGYVYCPPREEQIIAMGFKPVVDNRPEQEPNEGHWWKPVYSEESGEIVISYVPEKLEIPEPVSIG